MALRFQQQSVLLKDAPVGVVCITEMDFDNQVTNPVRYLVKEHQGSKVFVMKVDPKTATSEDIVLSATSKMCLQESDTPEQVKPFTSHKITYGAHVYGYHVRISYSDGNYNDWVFGNKGKESHSRAKPNGVTAKIEDMLMWAKAWAERVANEHSVLPANITHDPSLDEQIRVKWNQIYKLEY